MRIDFYNSLSTVKTLKRNKMRSFLTSLGIIIGISSVIIIMSVGDGAQSLVINQVRGIGSDLIAILPGASDDEGPPASAMGINITTLVYDDLLAVKDQVDGVEAIAPYVRGTAVASYQNKKIDTSFLGTTSEYMNVETNAEVVQGHFITPEEDEQVSRVAVLGSKVAEDLFGNLDPIGERIKVDKESFRVIGVMKSRGSSGFQDNDNQIFISKATAQKLMLGINYISFARARANPDIDVRYIIDQVKGVLRDQHNIDNPEEDDFSVRSSEEALDLLTNVTDGLNYFLALVAAISLLVGGIGIMNIMLVSVSESTKEIGLRKAVGATKGDISSHFLVQTLILTLLGGIIGVISGAFVSFVISLVVNYLGYEWDYIVSFFSIFLSLSFAVLVGLVFGWYPARKAAKLNPIEALRYE